MRVLLNLLAALIFTVLPIVALAQDGAHDSAPDRVILFDSDDAAMNAAIAKARDTLPAFWKMFATPEHDVEGFSLKLAISDDKMTEHFWCSDVEGNSERATCSIANEPQHVFTVSMGQTVDVDPAIISDWMYRRDGKIVGGQTIRVMVTTMPPDEAAQYKAMLADE